METEQQQNTPSNAATVFGALVVMFFVQGVFGFLAWAAYQTAAAGIPILPSITLMTGLGLWWLYFLIMFLPISLYIMLSSSMSNKTKEIDNVNTTGQTQ